VSSAIEIEPPPSKTVFDNVSIDGRIYPQKINTTYIEEMIEKNESINYNGVYITGDLEIPNYPDIKQPLKITNSIVEGYVDLFGTTFSNEVDFKNTEFLKSVDFSETHFKSQSRFADTKFQGDANFLRTKFERDANFWGAQFNNTAYFNEAQFYDKAIFSQANFAGDAHFRLSRFYADSAFWHVQFFGDTKFQDSELLGEISFDEAEFKRTFYLTGAEFYQLDARWDSIKDALVCDEPIYRNLVRNYNDLGLFSDADDCYYAYRWISQSNERGFVSKLSDYLLLISCGYGVRPHYTLILSIILILSFGFVYWLGKGIKRTECPKDKSNSCEESLISIIDSIYFSMMVFVSPSTEFATIGRYKYVAMIERILGWALLTIFIIILIRVAIR
jgi:hypothetical protein